MRCCAVSLQPQVVTCTAVNHLHRRAVRFDLKIPANEDSEDFVYNATGNTHLLPDYMKVRACSFEVCSRRCPRLCFCICGVLYCKLDRPTPLFVTDVCVSVCGVTMPQSTVSIDEMKHNVTCVCARAHLYGRSRVMPAQSLNDRRTA